MAKVGLVLGGGGISGAAFHFGVLLAVEMATGWKARDADVIVGTSCGSVVAALARGDAISTHGLVGNAPSRKDYARRLHDDLYRPHRPGGVVRWLRHGFVPGLRRGDIRMLLGSPARYDTSGLAAWIRRRIGRLADEWPRRPTLISTYQLEGRRRVAFGTEGSPRVGLAQAAAASSAVPVVFEPVRIEDRWYVDGGIVSGTHADLVLGSPEPLDLLLVVAPMAADVPRPGAPFYETMLDRAGRSALRVELEAVAARWPATDVVIVRPDMHVMEVMRPNPLATEAAVPSFLRTLRSMKSLLAHPTTWATLQRHLTIS